MARTQSIRILIIGGGIAGLALAQGLKKHNLPFTIFERDVVHNHRTQGYRIRVSREAVEALQYLLPTDLWQLFELAAAETRLGPIIAIDAKTAELNTVDFSKQPVGRPPVDAGSKPYTMDRTVLRQILLRGLDSHIQFGKEFERFSVDAHDSTVTAYFSDGTSEAGTLVVGADGSRSAVRKELLPNMRMLDIGARCIYGKTPLTPEIQATIDDNALQRMANIKDSSVHSEHLLSMVLEPIVFEHRSHWVLKASELEIPDDYIYWVLITHPDILGLPANPSEGHKLTYDESASLASEATKQWHPRLRSIIQNQMAGQTALLPLKSASPDIPTWQTCESVTVIGDAIHPMSPAAGSGAVTALRDAHHLCAALVEKAGVAKYEAEMREYAGQAIGFSFMAGKKLFGQKAWQECQYLADA